MANVATRLSNVYRLMYGSEFTFSILISVCILLYFEGDQYFYSYYRPLTIIRSEF
jgi:hypothetical protein